MKKRGAFLTVLCLSLLFSAPVLAETKKEKAKRLFEKGVAALDAHNYKDALKAFEKAYNTSPHWMVLGLIGNCNAKLAEPAKAIVALEQYLDEGGAQITPDERRAAQKLLREERKKVGYLVIEIGIPDAEVKIDGDSIGKPPHDKITLKAGVHHVMVVDGNDLMEEDITILARQEYTLRFPKEEPVPLPIPDESEGDSVPESPPEKTNREFEFTSSKETTKFHAYLPNGPSGPYWAAVALTAAGVISAGLGWTFFISNSASESNYANKITGPVPDHPGDVWSNYSWSQTCNSGKAGEDGQILVEGGPVGVYFCNTEQDRREFERKADMWKIPAIVGSAVVISGVTASILFYTHPEWFDSSDESARIHVTPVLGSRFQGLSLTAAF